MSPTVSIKEIAAKTGRSVRHLQRLAAAGDLPSKPAANGHRIYENTEALRKWIAEEGGRQRWRRSANPRSGTQEATRTTLSNHLMKASSQAGRIWRAQAKNGQPLTGLRYLENLYELAKSLQSPQSSVRPTKQRREPHWTEQVLGVDDD